MRLLETIPGDCANPWTKLANAFRNRVRTSLVSIQNKENGQQSAILASLIIGDYTGLQMTTREAFQNTGTFHVLVVSGLHVVWITGLLLAFFKFILIPERIRYLLAAFALLDVHMRCRISGKHYTMFVDIYFVFSRPPAFSQSRSFKHSLYRSANSPGSGTRLVV